MSMIDIYYSLYYIINKQNILFLLFSSTTINVVKIQIITYSKHGSYCL